MKRLQSLPLSASFTCCTLASCLLGGCRPATPNSTVAVLPVALRGAAPVADQSAVRSSDLFYQAQQACKRKDFRTAASLLDRLSRTPGFAPHEIAFCLQQRDLCLKDAGLPVAASPASPETPRATLLNSDCGPRALRLVCQKLGIETSLVTLRHEAKTTRQGTTLAGLADAARSVGLKAEGVQLSRQALSELDSPAIAPIHEHFIALLSVSGSGDRATAVVHDPNAPNEETISQEKLLQMTGGRLLLVRK